MRKYETMYIVNATLEEAKRQEIIAYANEIITSNGGNIIKSDEWGTKELAYQIDDMSKGYYVVLTFEADNAAVKEFDRLMRIKKEVVRFMTIRKDEE